MATRESIEFDFQRACAQANELDSVASNLRNLSNNKLSGSMQILSNNWKGSNASAYLDKGNALQGDIKSTANELSNIASSIRTIARNIYNAEMANLARAESRTYQ